MFPPPNPLQRSPRLRSGGEEYLRSYRRAREGKKRGVRLELTQGSGSNRNGPAECRHDFLLVAVGGQDPLFAFCAEVLGRHSNHLP
jgi:hypothetical protein